MPITILQYTYFLFINFISSQITLKGLWVTYKFIQTQNKTRTVGDGSGWKFIGKPTLDIRRDFLTVESKKAVEQFASLSCVCSIVEILKKRLGNHLIVGGTLLSELD
uniref:Uncharacterized protein n=1 Tax=Micrurus carvalhoi TaxID=3147026 RepID=A0A2H6MYN3_9SAUR